MEIQPNPNASRPEPASLARIVARRPLSAVETVSFAGSAAVNRALDRTPESRVEVVERARQLVGDPTYPPPETIRKLSHLLAMHLPQLG